MKASLFHLAVAGVAGLVALVAESGCATSPLANPAVAGPFFTPTNHAGQPWVPTHVRRVVLLPLYGGAVAPADTVAALDSVLSTALNRQNRFEVVTLSRADCWNLFHASELNSSSALPQNFMAILRREFAADAVLFVDVTAFRAYTPLVLGLRGKLALIDGSPLVWTFDNVFSADELAVANSARRYVVESDHRGIPADMSPAVLQSPSRFASYAAAAMWGTLPLVAPLFLNP